MRHRTAPRLFGSAVRIVAAACLTLPGVPATSAEPEPQRDESTFLSGVRRLTFEGRRAGEGYFAPDGRRIVFQSEREPGNPFYQIYELDLTDGETRRVSNGTGKTTCAFYHPDGRHILYASTHDDPNSAGLQKEELELRASGQQRRYEWDYDPEMEIYVAEVGGAEPVRLTDARGYDAEGSYSPDGRWIVFTSNRLAYREELSASEREKLEVDPAYFADLYLMRSDGSEPRRLTTVKGYDGGPFFSADGTRIYWRRFDEEGLHADIWTMSVKEGSVSSPQRLTDFGSMSWAPFPHPSGEYVVFTSNKLGFGNFELYIVDAAGKKQPVRVSFTDGFDGLPVFSPEGERLAWTSTRYAEGAKGQIFLARWNHRAALHALEEAPPRGGGASSATEEP